MKIALKYGWNYWVKKSNHADDTMLVKLVGNIGLIHPRLLLIGEKVGYENHLDRFVFFEKKDIYAEWEGNNV